MKFYKNHSKKNINSVKVSRKNVLLKNNAIIHTTNINDVIKACSKVTPKTLIVFDVDDVLMTPMDKILKTKNKFINKNIIKAFNSSLSDEESIDIWSAQWSTRKTTVVNPMFIKILNTLIANNVHVLLLTNSITGGFGTLKSIEDFRIHELKSLGYQIEKIWPEIKATLFPNMSKFIRGAIRHPLFKSGIMFTCGCRKGDTLREFLDIAQFTPDKIVCIDDKTENLVSVAGFAQDINAEFLGVEYHESYSLSDKIDEEIARLQFNYLKKYKIWLSDQEAEEKLNDGFIIENQF